MAPLTGQEHGFPSLWLPSGVGELFLVVLQPHRKDYSRVGVLEAAPATWA